MNTYRSLSLFRWKPWCHKVDTTRVLADFLCSILTADKRHNVSIGFGSCAGFESNIQLNDGVGDTDNGGGSR